jgi:hypothetical protein
MGIGVFTAMCFLVCCILLYRYVWDIREQRLQVKDELHNQDSDVELNLHLQTTEKHETFKREDFHSCSSFTSDANEDLLWNDIMAANSDEDENFSSFESEDFELRFFAED